MKKTNKKANNIYIYIYIYIYRERERDDHTHKVKIFYEVVPGQFWDLLIGKHEQK